MNNPRQVDYQIVGILLVMLAIAAVLLWLFG